MIRARLASRRLRRVRISLPTAVVIVALTGGLAWATEPELPEGVSVERIASAGELIEADGCRDSVVGGTRPGC